jgi:hypothetical protein
MLFRLRVHCLGWVAVLICSRPIVWRLSWIDVARGGLAIAIHPSHAAAVPLRLITIHKGGAALCGYLLDLGLVAHSLVEQVTSDVMERFAGRGVHRSIRTL